MARSAERETSYPWAVQEHEVARMLTDAADRGVFDPELPTIADRFDAVTIGEASRTKLLGIYRRRLNLSSNDALLADFTESLVRFLENYSKESISWIDVNMADGTTRTFLGDKEDSTILFWMKILDRPTSGQYS